MESTTILRLPAIQSETGLSRSSIYRQRAEGLLTRPVHISQVAVGWPAAEIRAILQARIAGKSDAEIRKLVRDLEAARGEAA
jgi:prophage regulatory protein